MQVGLADGELPAIPTEKTIRAETPSIQIKPPVKLEENEGEGNCFFHTLSQETGQNYMRLRELLGYRCLFDPAVHSSHVRRILSDGAWSSEHDIALSVLHLPELLPYGAIMFVEEEKTWFYFGHSLRTGCCIPDSLVYSLLSCGWRSFAIWHVPQHFRR